jgi:hypothetical protein
MREFLIRKCHPRCWEVEHDMNVCLCISIKVHMHNVHLVTHCIHIFFLW